MSLALANKCNLWQVDSVVDFVVENHQPKFCLSYMYIQHRHRLYGILRIWYVPFLDKITYDNAYSSLWHRLVLCVKHKVAMMETGFYLKKNLICLQHQHPPAQYNPFMIILTRPSDTVWFCVWNTKLQWWKLVFIKNNNNLICLQHQHPPAQDNPFMSTSIYLNFLCIFLDRLLHVYVPHETGVFEILCPN